MDDFWSAIMRRMTQYDLRGHYVWHDDKPKYIKKKEQGIVFAHEVKILHRIKMIKNVPLLHRKIAPLGKRSKKIWEIVIQ